MTKKFIQSNIKRLRDNANLTQIELSRLTGLSETTISSYESGKSGLDCFQRVDALCTHLKCKPSDLFTIMSHKNLDHEFKAIAIAGGSGAGKTTLANKLLDYYGDDAILISHDRYYRGKNDKAEEEDINYDEPHSLENNLLVQHLERLCIGDPIRAPIYDFTTHTRQKNSDIIVPRPIIIVEGILLLAIPQLFDLFDFTVFIDTPEFVRVSRRLLRDVNERNRTVEDICNQLQTQVLPMHKKYVSDCVMKADLVVSGETPLEELVSLVSDKLEESLGIKKRE